MIRDGLKPPSLIGMSLIHGYTTGFWVAAAIFGAGSPMTGPRDVEGGVPTPLHPAPARRTLCAP